MWDLPEAKRTVCHGTLASGTQCYLIGAYISEFLRLYIAGWFSIFVPKLKF